ncbi:MAG: diacylglycerol kinase [Methylococcales bacterium]|jgi:diacylglycerol kinase (ATP)|nr:diacylglycerol kinase [Methylococcales bacterium]
MANQAATGLKRLINAWHYSWAGLRATYREEEAFRQETVLAVVLIPLAIWLADTSIELVLLIVSVLFLLLTEVLNSAIEAVVDRFGGEQHELSGRAKDMGSAAVLIAMLMVAVTWGCILLPKLMA